MNSNLAQLLQKRRENYRQYLRTNNEYFAYSAQKYAASVKVDFVAVLDRQYTKRGAS